MPRPFRRLFGPTKPIRTRRKFRPWLERLEDRWTPAKYLLLASDNQFHLNGMAAELNNSDQIAGDVVETFNCTNAVPTLNFLKQYTSVLAFTTLSFPNGTAVGNLLADYVDGGGRVVLATYAFSQSWAIGGRIMNAPYSPFAAAPDGTDFTMGEGSPHTLAGYDTQNPLFAGFTNPPTYWVASDYTNPPLNAGATLLASDLEGNRVVAVNQAESVYGVSISAAALGIFTTDQNTYRLFINAMIAEPGGGTHVTAISPSLTNGPLSPGLNSLKVTFNKTVVGANRPFNYALQGAGPDTTLGTSDDVFFSVTPTFSDGNHTATLKFAPLPSDSYRLTVKGNITDTGGHPLSGGDFVRDFDANAPVNYFNLNLNSVVRGKLVDPLATDRWSFTVPAGQQVKLNVVARQNPDVLFDLIDPNGDSLLVDQDQTSDVVTLDLAGTYSVVVHARNSVDGGAYSFSLDQTVQTPLALGTPFNGTFLSSGQVQLFKITVPTGNPLRVTLDDTNINDINEIYLRRGLPPTRGTYDFRANGNTADQTLLAPFASDGTWYVLVYARKTASASNFSLLAESSPVFVTSVTPGGFPTNQTATVTVSGAGFVPGSLVSLTRSGGPTVNATTVKVDSFAQLSATFDLNGVPAGNYDVKVTLPGGATDTLANGFIVFAAGQARLETKLELPEVLGRHQAATFYIEYANTGNAPMPAPILILQNTNELRPLLTLNPKLLVQGLWTSALPKGFSNEIQIYASGDTPGILMPGERKRVPVYYAGLQQPWDFDNDNTQSYEIAIEEAGDSELIPWADMKADLQPSWMPAAAWDAVYANLQAQIGPTWGDYVRMLSNNAQYLARLGERVTDAGELFTFAALQAAGDISATSLIASSTDAGAVAPGLSLSFTRTFGADIVQRYQVGLFGRGWSAPWQITLQESLDGTITLTDTAGMERQFKPDIRGVGRYLSGPGDSGVLRKASGGWELTDTSGMVTRFRADHTLEYIQDINGNRITTTFTAGKLTKLTHSSGAWIDITYNPTSLISSLTSHAGAGDVTGRTTTYAYDLANLLLTSATGPGGTTTYGYDTGNNPARKYALTSITDGSNVTRTYEYDAFGRIADSFLPGNVQRVDYAYDRGSVTTTDQAGVASTLFFDHRGLLLRQEDGLGDYLRYTYDDLRHLTRVVDALGHAVDYTRCDCGRPVTIADQYGNLTRFTLGGPHNNARSMTDANGNATHFGYDAKGNLTTTTYADDSVQTVIYDAQGLPQELVNRRGQHVTLTRNVAGQITAENFPDSTSNTYTYDTRGRMQTATDSHGTTTFSYDSADRLTRVDYPGGRFVQYTYDGAGRRATMEDNSGLKLHYLYDAAGRLSEVKDATNVVETRIVLYTYDLAGRVSREDHGNNTYTIYTYDGAARVASITNYSSSNAINSQFVYSYDALDRETTAQTSDGTWTYTYDLTGQLTHAVFDSTNVNISDQDLTHEYDAVGNRVRTLLNGVETLYAANGLDEYATVGGVSYSYDADGNLTGDGARAYAYDAFGRLTQVAGGGNTWQYEYDAFGNRVATVFNGARTEYLNDPTGLGNIIGTYDGSNTRTGSFVHGLRLEASAVSGNWDYFDTDATGSVVGLNGNAGTYVNSYAYDPFGGSLYATEGVANPFQYAGGLGVTNEGNGLAFMRARFYSVSLGSFITPDPLGLGGGDINFYRYASNDPVNFADASGLSSATFGWSGSPVPGLSGTAMIGLDFDTCSWYYIWGGGFTTGGVTVASFSNGGLSQGTTVDVHGTYGSPGAGSTAHGYVTGNFHDMPNAGTSFSGDVGYEVAGPFAGGIDILGSVYGGEIEGCWEKKLKDAKKPKPKGKKGPGSDTGTAKSQDPNEILGPVGFGPANYVAADRSLAYRINFENDASATAPAQHVLIVSDVPADLDWSSFEFTGFGFGDTTVDVPPGSQHFETKLPMTFNGNFFNVEIVGDFDATTRRVTVTFDSVDPISQLPPDVLTGFLPPEDGTGRGQGYFTYSVLAAASVPSGTEVRSVALVQFDTNPFIATNQADEHDPTKGINPAREALVTLDAGTPTATMALLPALTTSTTVQLGWSGVDEAGGSGVGGYDVYVSDNNGPFTLLTHTTQRTATFAGQDHHSYRFYVLATDNVDHPQPNQSPVIRQTEIALPPAAFGDTYAVTPGRKLTVTADNGVLKNDRNTSPRRALTAVLVGSVTKGALTLRGDGSFTYIPGQTFDGSDQFTYKIRDNAGHESNVVTVALTSQVISFRVDTSAVGEAAGSGKLWVDLRMPAAQTLTVDYDLGVSSANGGEDFVLPAGTLTFSVGQRSKAIPFTVVDDRVDEIDETFKVMLNNPSAGALGRSESNVTIRDNDLPPVIGFASASSRSSEADLGASLAVTLSAPSAKQITVQIRPAAARGPGLAGLGGDVTAPPLTVMFAPGETVKSIPISLVNDNVHEPDETVRFVLSNAVNASLARSTHTLTIVDDDATPKVSFAADTSNVSEGVGFVELTVTLSGPSSRPVTVDVRITGGSAAAADFNLMTGRLTFAAGETTKKLRLFIVDDANAEGDETVVISLQSPSNALLGAFVGHTLTITDND